MALIHPRFRSLLVLVGLFTGAGLTAPASAQGTPVEERADSVSVRFVDADLRAVVQSLGRYLPKPVLSGGLPGLRVSLETPAPVPRAMVAVLLRGLIEGQGLLYQEDSAYVRLGPAPPRPEAGGGGPGGGVPVQLFVLRLRHAKATTVASTVNLLYGGSGEFSGRPGFANGTLSDELRRAAPAPGGAPSPAGGGNALAGPITIVPDELTNSLLIRASRADYDLIEQAVQQLDIRPLQVLIEVLIVEARRTRDFSLGTSIFVPQQGISGDADGSIGGQTRGGGVGDLVLRLLNLGKANIDATLSASESRGDVRIVSRPVLLASNGREASFLVGSQRPFVQVSRLLPTDNNNQDRVVQYRDVGTRLRVLPTINPDGYVALLLQQEINAATNEVAFDAPVISTREAVTELLVKDGQTIMLGGLTDEQRDQTRSGVPLLSGLPVVGGLFGSQGRTSSQTELYLFITPRIIRSDEDADRLTSPHLPKDESR